MATGVEWKPIRTTGNSYRKKDPLDSSERFYALDLECVRPSTRSMEEDAHLVRLYIEKNLDGTNMPLVPTFNSVPAGRCQQTFYWTLGKFLQRHYDVYHTKLDSQHSSFAHH